MGSPTRRARLTGWEKLEDRDQPAAAPLADLATLGASAFLPFDLPGGGGGVVNGKMFFTAADGPTTIGLYASDGTAAGTTKVADVTSTFRTPAPPSGLFPPTTPVVALGNRVYFTRADAAGPELWSSDGTAAGTKQVADLYPGAQGSSPGFFTPVNGRLVFAAYTPEGGQYPDRHWYSTDGTAAGTTLLFPAGTSSVSDPVAAGGKLYFTSTAMTGPPYQPVSTIWASDGTAAGTKPFVTLPENVQPDSFAPAWAAVANGNLYFSAGDATAGRELWVTDGTAAGTRMVKDVNPTSRTDWYPGDFSVTSPRGSSAAQFTAVGNAVYFAADDGEHGQELWKTDGTAAGTEMVADLSPTVGSPWYDLTGQPSGSRIAGLTAVNGRLYFAADDGVHGQQFYTSDGTTAGTVPLTAVSRAGAPQLYGFADAQLLGTVGGRVLFAFGNAAGAPQLWATDGTAAGTAVVRATGGATNSLTRAVGLPSGIGTVGGTFLYSADDGVNGRQLWATDGTAAGTRMVKRLNPADLGSDPAGFVTAGSTAFFTAAPAPGFSAVYATDGTAPPRLLKQFDLAANDAPGQLTSSGNRAFFVVKTGSLGRQLWATDGNAAGARLVKDVPPPADAPGSSSAPGIGNLTDAAGTLYFTLDLPGSGQELWKTDGTAAGTVRLAGVAPQSSAEAPIYTPPGTATWGPIRQLTAVGTRVFFAGGSGPDGEELWVSDGTAAGTRRVTDIAPLGSSAPTDLTALNGKLYFTADDMTNGRQLWVSDGTAAGTRLAATINTGAPAGSPWLQPTVGGIVRPREVVAAGGKLFVVGFDPAHGRQLWVSDGTTAGTTRLTDIGTVSMMSSVKDAGIAGLTAVGSRVYFVAGDPTNGRQVWVSDGTAAGTRMVKAVAAAPPGAQQMPTWQTVPSPGDPRVLAAVGDRVVFSAPTAAGGRQLWATDGTAAGTRMIADTGPDTAPSGDPYATTERAAVVGGRLVFAATDAAHGREPWSLPATDFTPTTPPVVPPVVPPTVPPVVPPTVPPVSPPVVTPPTATAAVTKVFALTGTEGTAATFNLATVSLPEGPTYRATVFWGDGRTAVGTLTRGAGTTYTITAAHEYAFPGEYAVLVRVTADYKTVLSIDTKATVADARFYAGRVAQRLPAGQEFFGVVATIRDTNPTGGRAADFTASINWGDGETTDGIVRRTAAGAFEVVGRHTYAAAGRPVATVTIRSAGATATAVSLFTIDPARVPPPA